MMLLCSFPSLKDANDVISTLHGAGYGEAYIEVNKADLERKEPAANIRDISSYVGLAPKKVASTSSPGVTGFGSFEEIAGITCKVFVEVTESDSDEAKKIITDAGGGIEGQI